MKTMRHPRIAVTMGDAAGIGPEVVIRACLDPLVRALCRPVVVGNASVLRRAAELIGADVAIQPVADFSAADADAQAIFCFDPGPADVIEVPPGTTDPRAGRAAYVYVTAAAHAALDGHVHAVVTAPLNKAAMRRAGLPYPGHTEILADVCGVRDFAMMLFLPVTAQRNSPHGLGVAHVTLHTSIRSVPDLLTVERIRQTVELIDHFLRRVGCDSPRIGVCALNPHAGEEGLFGDEERLVISPAVAAARESGHNVAGPFPADTLMRRAVAGEFDGVAAMYHDQGHIALKLVGWERSVNVTLGLPIVRTSPSHGTAYDIAWQGRADVAGMREAIRVATVLAEN